MNLKQRKLITEIWFFTFFSLFVLSTLILTIAAFVEGYAAIIGGFMMLVLLAWAIILIVFAFAKNETFISGLLSYGIFILFLLLSIILAATNASIVTETYYTGYYIYQTYDYYYIYALAGLGYAVYGILLWLVTNKMVSLRKKVKCNEQEPEITECRKQKPIASTAKPLSDEAVLIQEIQNLKHEVKIKELRKEIEDLRKAILKK